MSKQQSKRAHSVSNETNSLSLNIRRTAVSLAVAAALPGVIMMPSVAFAQDDSEEVIEEIITTGFRGSLRDAMLMKQNSESIVEAITAEDIGKLPDASIAESLARLPGLTAQRLNGRGQQISIRGLGPDFTTALLNGREQVTTGDNRGVEFDQYPSELLSGVTVYKTPDASLIGAGLAGTADLKTIRPLQHGKRTLHGNVRYEWTEYDALNAGSDDDGYRYTLTYIDQFADDTVGIAIGYAGMSNPGQEERFNSWGYPTTAAGDAVIGGAKPYVRSSTLDRDGIIGVLEYNPTDTVSTSLDIYYSKFEEFQQLRGIELPLIWGGVPLEPGATVDNGLVTAGQFNGVKGVMRNDITARDSELFAAGFNVNFDVGENWVADVDLSMSSVDRQDIILETYSGTGTAGAGATDNMGFVMDGTTGAVFSSSLDYTDPNLIMLTSPQGWGGGVIPGGQLGYDNRPEIDDELKQIALSMERELSGTISSMEFGVNLANREKVKGNNEFFLGLASGATEAPLQNITGVTDLSFLGIPGMISYDPLAAIASGIYSRAANPNADVAIKGWTVEEDTNIAFIKFGLDTEIGNLPLVGNFGLQYMDVDQSSTALAASGTDGRVSNSGGDSWSEVLPSLNLSLQVADNTYVRFATARTVSKARMDDLRASFEYSYDPTREAGTTPGTGPWGGGGGNPTLKPWLATAIDLSFEKYFAEGAGYVSLAYFYKDIDQFIIPDFPVLTDFTGFPVPPGQNPGTFEGFISAPINGDEGSIDGFELAVQFSGDLIHDSIRDFGVVANYSSTDSSIKPIPGSDFEIDIPGLSKDVANVTLYYENESFSARVSNRYRSKFLGEVGGFGGGRSFKEIKSESVLDAQVSYTFSGGTFDGMTLLLQGYNLTDEPMTTFAGDNRLIIDYQSYGASYMIGASYSYE
jgi:iron complex outermembrane receptor protein